MNLVRLERHRSTRPPQRDLRQYSVQDSRERVIGHVADLYVQEEDGTLRFVDLIMGGFLGLGRKHYLIPVEAIAETLPGLVVLKVDKETIEQAPIFPNPHAGPDPGYQRTIREHYS